MRLQLGWALLASGFFLSTLARGQDLSDRGIQKLHFPSDSFSPPQPQACALTYYGGPVISNVAVVQVSWGSGVDATVTNNLPLFYADIVNSPYIDWLCEYNTNVRPVPTSSQAIGRGTFYGLLTITPSVGATPPATVTNTQIQNELVAQINAGVLPQPTFDAQGHVNTVYMIHFPSGITITRDSSTSCVQFCAYHYSVTINGIEVPYGVMPYIGSGSACNGGCGAGTYLQNIESVSSHELVEAITDTDVALAATFAAPLAWYGRSGCNPNGEIGDICNGSQASITVNGHTHTVQKQWSNRANACIAVAAGTQVDCPCISAVPSATASCPGGGASFSVTASGGSLTYQWRRNTTPLVDAAGHIAGANTASLVLTNLIAGDAGTYDVLVGSSTCTATTLTTPGVALSVTPDATTPNVTPPPSSTAAQSLCS